MASRLKAFNECLRLDPKFVDAYEGRGIIFLHSYRYTEALKDFDEAIRLADVPQFRQGGLRPLSAFNISHLQSARARCLCGLKRYKEALEACDTALKLDPTNSGAASFKAIVRELGKL